MKIVLWLRNQNSRYFDHIASLRFNSSSSLIQLNELKQEEVHHQTRLGYLISNEPFHYERMAAYWNFFWPYSLNAIDPLRCHKYEIHYKTRTEQMHTNENESRTPIRRFGLETKISNGSTFFLFRCHDMAFFLIAYGIHIKGFG